MIFLRLSVEKMFPRICQSAQGRYCQTGRTTCLRDENKLIKLLMSCVLLYMTFD